MISAFRRAFNNSYCKFLNCQLKRFVSFDLYEYQTKILLEVNSIPIQRFEIVRSVDQVAGALKRLRDNFNITRVGIKAQVKTGSRGKGIFNNGFKGGVKQVSSDDNEVLRIVSNMLGHRIETPQTGPSGELCNSVILCEWFGIDSEKYLSFMIDNEMQLPVILFNGNGGASIEDSASTQKIYFIPGYELNEYDLDTICTALNFDKKHHSRVKKCILDLFNLFVDNRLNLLEINPFSIGTECDSIICFDAKANIDENHVKLLEQLDSSLIVEEENEIINLGGNIGCFANGAGLAMATMDTIQSMGGNVSVFYDIGGKSDGKSILKAIEQVSCSDALLINLHGGIVDCYEVAEMLTLNLPYNFKNVFVVVNGNNSHNATTHFETRGIKVFKDLVSAAYAAVKIGVANAKDNRMHELPETS